MKYLGDIAEDATIHFMFTTNDREGAAVAPSSAFEAADILIYKDNGATQKATANGITMTSPFDSVTGLHAVTIDTSVDTGDTGFWATGSNYICVLSPDETVDAKTVVSVVASFSIQNRYMRGTDSAYTGTPPTVTQIRQEIDSNSTQLTLIVGDTNEFQTDWVNGGRLDLILDARASQVTADAILADTGTDGVVVAAASKTGYRLSATGVDDVLDEAVEGTRTLRQILRGYSAALLGKISGGGTATEVFRDIDDSKDRITATVDEDGNRTAITIDLT